MIYKRIKAFLLLVTFIVSGACVSEASFLGFGTPEVSAPELLKQYTTDETKADKEYRGKKIIVTGRINSFGKSGSEYQVFLEDASILRDVVCEFPESEAGKLAKLSRGQEVRITGTCNGLMINVYVKNCTLNKPEVGDYFNSDIDTTRPIHVVKILNDYGANKIAASLKYNGKSFKVSGKIYNFDSDSKGAYIELDPERERLSIEILDVIEEAITNRIKCYVPKNSKKQLMFLSKGQQVVISGMCNGLNFNDCTIDEPFINDTDNVLLPSERLIREFNSDKKIANLKYNGERFSISGVTKSFGEANNGVYVSVGTDNYSGSINCYFPKSEAFKIAQLNKGQQVIITGNCNVTSGNGVILEACVLDEPILSEIEPDTDLSIEQLLNIAHENETTINILYKGKTLTISGVMDNFSESNEGIYVVLKASGLSGKIDCYMRKEALSQLLYLKEKQRITITGKCIGYNGNSIKVNDCVVIDPAIEINTEIDALLSPEEILGDVNANSVKAKIRYQDRQLMIKGNIESFTKKGHAYGVTLVSRGTAGDITCYFSQKELLKVTQLHKDENITVQGTYSQINNNVIIENCTLEAPDVDVSRIEIKDKLSVSEFLSEMSINEIAVDIKYGRKKVQISGIIGDIVCDDDKYYLTLSDENSSGNLKCYIQDETVRKIILYGDGDTISLSGICDGYIDGEIIFTKCLIASQIPNGGKASLDTLDSRNIDILNTLQDTHADYCRQIFQRNRMTKSRADIKTCLSVLNRFLTIWPKNLRNDDGNEVKQALDFLKAIQNGVSGRLIIAGGDFSKEDSFFDTPDMKINFVINGHNYSTGIINDNARPQFNEGFNLNWTVEIGAIKFTGVEVDTTFDDEVFSTSVDASGFKGYERLSGTLYSNGNSLTIRFSPSQSLPVCPW